MQTLVDFGTVIVDKLHFIYGRWTFCELIRKTVLLFLRGLAWFHCSILTVQLDW